MAGNERRKGKGGTEGEREGRGKTEFVLCPRKKKRKPGAWLSKV